VHNLHGLPSLLGGFVSAIATSEYFGQRAYGADYNVFFPNGALQPKYQLAGMAVSLGFALVGGVLVGLAMRLLFRPLRTNELFSDAPFFHMPPDFKDFSDDEHTLPMTETLTRRMSDAGSRKPVEAASVEMSEVSMGDVRDTENQAGRS
jgi:hypothetical protein